MNVKHSFWWEVRNTGGAIFPTVGANAPPVKQLKNALSESKFGLNRNWRYSY